MYIRGRYNKQNYKQKIKKTETHTLNYSLAIVSGTEPDVEVASKLIEKNKAVN